MIAQELKRLGWPQGELAARRKADPDKLALRPGCGGKRR
jgi:hypothetical protein